jgi:PAS domain S-box-containing protein
MDDARETGTELPSDPAVELHLKERALDEAPIGVTLADATREDAPLVYTNRAFEALTGYAAAEALGRNCRFLQGPATDPGPVAQMRAAVAAGEPVTVELRNYRKDGTRFWNRVDIAPIQNRSGEVTHFVGFQTDVTARRDAERQAERRAAEARRERESLQRLLDRLNGLFWDVTETLVRADSREATERAVCRRFAAAEAYEGAWIGALDPGGESLTVAHWNGAVAPAASDGKDRKEGADSDGNGAEIEIDVGSAGSALARGISEGASQVVSAADLSATGMRATGAVEAAAVVPLIYRSTCHGVLAVYAADRAVFDDQERAVLEALGRSVATGLSALESRELIASDTVVGVECELADPELFPAVLAERAACRLTYRGSAPQDDDSRPLFFETEADPAAVADAAAGLADVAGVESLGEGAARGTVVEIRAREPTLITDLAARGARVRSLVAEDGQISLGLELAAQTRVRPVVEWLRGRYESVRLAGVGDGTAPATREDLRTEVLGGLTKRQRTALQKAYLNGYYDATRQVTGEELAESMGLTRATFHQHRRAAERKVLEALLRTPD